MISQSIRDTALALFVVCALISSTPAQVQGDVQLNQSLGINPLVGAPTVTITSTTMLPGQGALIKWSVNKPTLTQVVSFDATVEVHYQNGKLREGKLSNLSGSLRESIVPVDLNTAPVSSIKATLITKYHTTAVLTDTRTFALGQTSGPGGSSQPGGGRAFELTGVTKLSTCAAGKDCFEVRWTTQANVASLVAFNNFSVKLDAVYANGQQVTSTGSTNGNQTQLNITIDRPNQTSATSATVKLTATVTLVGLVT